MAADNNNFTISGFVAVEPKQFTAQTGTVRFSFPLSFGKTVGEGDSAKRESVLVNMEAWVKPEKLALANDVLKKGSRVLCKGFFDVNAWEKDGVKRESLVLKVMDFERIDTAAAQQPAQ